MNNENSKSSCILGMNLLIMNIPIKYNKRITDPSAKKYKVFLSRYSSSDNKKDNQDFIYFPPPRINHLKFYSVLLLWQHRVEDLDYTLLFLSVQLSVWLHLHFLLIVLGSLQFLYDLFSHYYPYTNPKNLIYISHYVTCILSYV